MPSPEARRRRIFLKYMVIFKGENERAAGAIFFFVYMVILKGKTGTSAPQARKFLRYTTIFKGEIGYERAAGAKILDTPDFSNLKS